MLVYQAWTSCEERPSSVRCLSLSLDPSHRTQALQVEGITIQDDAAEAEAEAEAEPDSAEAAEGPEPAVSRKEEKRRKRAERAAKAGATAFAAAAADDGVEGELQVHKVTSGFRQLLQCQLGDNRCTHCLK